MNIRRRLIVSLRALGRLELMKDERFCSYPVRQKHFQAVWAFVTEELAQKTNAE